MTASEFAARFVQAWRELATPPTWRELFAATREWFYGGRR